MVSVTYPQYALSGYILHMVVPLQNLRAVSLVFDSIQGGLGSTITSMYSVCAKGRST